MADSTYTFEFTIDSSRAEAQAREFADLIRRQLENTQIDIGGQQSAGGRGGPSQALENAERSAKSLEERLKEIQRIDVSAGIEDLNDLIDGAEARMRRINDTIQSSLISGVSQHGAQWKQTLEDYYRAVEQMWGRAEADIARGRGTIHSLGDIHAEFPQDQSPPSEWNQTHQQAYSKTKEKQQQTRQEQIEQARLESEYYEAQIQAAKAQQELYKRQTQALVENMNEINEADSSAELIRLGDAANEANEAEKQAIEDWKKTQETLARFAEEQAEVARKARLDAGDLTAGAARPAGGGAIPTSRVQVTVADRSADAGGRLADHLERAQKALIEMTEAQDRLNASQRTQNQLALDQVRAKAQAEAQAKAAAEIQVEAARQQTNAEKATLEQLRLQNKEQTEANTIARAAEKIAATELAQENRITAELKAEIAERRDARRRETTIAVEQARQRRIQIQEQERRLTARIRSELRERGQQGVSLRQIGYSVGGALGIYGADQIARATYGAGRAGAEQQQLAETYQYLAAQARIAGDEMIQAIQEASRQTIPEISAIGYANQVLAQRFASSSQDIIGETEVLIRAARRFSQVYVDETGQAMGVEEIFGRLIKFVREGNKELVDQFGVSNQLIADTLGVPNEGLRGAEGAILRWQGLIKILGGELERLGEATDSTAEQIAGSEARITDATNRMRQALAPLTAEIAEFGARAAENLSDLLVDNGLDEIERNLDALKKVLDDPVIRDGGFMDIPIPEERLQRQVADLEQIRAAILEVSEAQQQASAAGMEDTYKRATEELARLKTLAEEAIRGPLGDEQIARLDVIIQSWDQVGNAIAAATIQAQGMNAQLAIMGNNVAAAVALMNERAEMRKPGNLGLSPAAILGQRPIGLPGAAGDAASALAPIWRDIAESRKREEEQAAKSAGSAWKNAAAETLRAFETAIGKVPGLFGTSDVTQADLDRAAAGLPVEYADNYLRRLRDEIENGIDWAGVDIADAAGAIGMDAGTDPRQILAEFARQWDTGELWANADNLRFMNFDAVRAEYDRQQRAETGRENLRQATADALGIDLAQLERALGVSGPVAEAADRMAQTIDDTRPPIEEAGKATAIALAHSGDGLVNAIRGITASLIPMAAAGAGAGGLGPISFTDTLAGLASGTSGGAAAGPRPTSRYGTIPPYSFTDALAGLPGGPGRGVQNATLDPGYGPRDTTIGSIAAGAGGRGVINATLDPGYGPRDTTIGGSITATTPIPGSGTVPIGPVLPPMDPFIPMGPLQPQGLQPWQGGTLGVSSLSGAINPNAPTRVVIHGYNEGPGAPWVQSMGQALTATEPGSNVLSVDWSNISQRGIGQYPTALQAIPVMAAELAGYLEEIGVDPALTQLIGHSTGAQIAGVTGSTYAGLTGSQLGRITGLDPSNILFQNRPPELKLDPSDAGIVDSYYTSSVSGWGSVPYGGVNVTANPNVPFQPGSRNTTGNHQYSNWLYIQSIMQGLSSGGTALGHGLQPGTAGDFTVNTSDPADQIRGLIPNLTLENLLPTDPGQIDEQLGDGPEAIGTRVNERIEATLGSAAIVAPVATAWGSDLDENIDEFDSLTDRVIDRVNNRLEENLGNLTGGFVSVIVANVLEALAGDTGGGTV